LFDPNHNAPYYNVCEWLQNGLNIIKTHFYNNTNNLFPWKDRFNGLKRANNNNSLQGWFLFLYNGRKEICAIAEKVLDKDNADIPGTYKYFLVLC
jgi:hypothetical protein